MWTETYEIKPLRNVHNLFDTPFTNATKRENTKWGLVINTTRENVAELSLKTTKTSHFQEANTSRLFDEQSVNCVKNNIYCLKYMYAKFRFNSDRLWLEVEYIDGSPYIEH